MNELCYVLRMSEWDFSVNWRTQDGFAAIPSVKEAFIPSRDLAQKIKVVGYDEDVFEGKTYASVVVEIL